MWSTHATPFWAPAILNWLIAPCRPNHGSDCFFPAMLQFAKWEEARKLRSSMRRPCSRWSEVMSCGRSLAKLRNGCNECLELFSMEHPVHHPAHPPHEQARSSKPAKPGYPEHPEHHIAHEHAANDRHAGHDKHAGHSVAMFRDKFWISLALTIPTLVWGHMLQRAFRYTAPEFPGARWIPPIFGTAVFLYGGWVFIQGAVRELRDRLPGMMSLISLAISVAFVFSAAVTLGYTGMPLWEELATLVTIMLLGHWIEMRSIQQAQGALKELAKLLPDMASRIEGNRIEEVPVSDLREGDLILVRPGASIPADGVVRQGESAVNESMITGESRP